MAFTDGVQNSNNSGGSASNTFGGGFTGFGGPEVDLNSSEGLLQLAKLQGGALGEVAQELTHPTTSILSTIGDGFKNAFKGFVDIISTPNQIVAGVLSNKYSVGEAIDQNISTSDVIWGEHDPEATTMKKVGSFLVRTATDILLDPLTYVTFGAGQGIAGLRSTTKVTLEETAAKTVGKKTLDQAALSAEGQQVFSYLKNVEMQWNGLAKAKQIQAGAGEGFELAGEELNRLLRETVDAPLNMDFAKKAISNALEKNPALTETLLDKGGIKFFGKSILSGQRVASMTAMIPGMTVLDNLTAPLRNSLQAVFDSSLVKTEAGWTRVPQEAMDIIQAGADLKAARTVQRGMDLADIVKGNKLSVEEAKLVTAAIEAKKLPADPRLANAVKQFLGFTDDELSFLSESGIPVAYRDGHVPHILVRNENITANIPMGRASGTGKASASYERKVAGTIAEAKEWGINFDENVVTAHFARTLDNTNVGVTKQVLSSVGESMGQVKSLAPEGWVGVNIKGVESGGKKLAEIFGDMGEEIVFHPAVAKRLEQFIKASVADDATAGVLKAFDSIQNLWKAGVTSIFPSFHGRNAISNVFLNMMDLGVHVLDPAKHIFATNMVATDRKVAKLTSKAYMEGEEGLKAAEELNDMLGKTMFADATGHDWTFGELRQVMKDRNIAFNKGLNGPMDITEGPEKVAKTFFKDASTKGDKAKNLVKKGLPVTQDFFLFEGGREVGRAIEEQARVLNFVANLKNTGDVNLAAARTKQFLFDYGNLTPFERTVLKRVMPFYTFTRKNLELQTKTLLTTPGRVSAEVTGLSNIGDALSGGSLTPEEEAALPDWIKSGIGILKNKKGSTVEILGSLGSPIEAPFAAFQPNAFLGSISPLLRVPVEQMSGYSFYQGKALSDVTNAAAFKHAPKAIQDFIGFTEVKGHKSDGTPFTWYVALRPERMNVINNMPLAGRVLSSVKQMEAQDVSTQMKTMQQLIGLRPYSFDLEQEAAKKEAETKKKLETLLTKAGVTAQYKRTFIPKEKTPKLGE